jgi:hypothetical protein
MIRFVSTPPSDEVTFGLRLDEAELKVAWAALCAFRDSLGHNEADVLHVVKRLLEKFPDEHTMRATRFSPHPS